ncbi:MAG: hypothetical protein M1571_02005 [Firmicutes bacterium]|nr:hypothetical protein [Bacillota bacterium]
MRKVIILLLVFLVCSYGTLPAAVLAANFTVTVTTPSPLDVTTGERFFVAATVYNTGAATVYNTEAAANVRLRGFTPAGREIAGSEIINLPSGTQRQVWLFGSVWLAGFHELARVEVINEPPAGQPLSISLPNPLLIRATDRATPPAGRALLDVAGVTFSPAVPIPGEPFQVHISVRNAGAAEASNVVVAFDGEKNFEVLDLTNRVSFTSLGSGSQRTASFRIRARTARESNQATLVFSYMSAERQETQEERLNLPLGEVLGQGLGLQVASHTLSEVRPDGSFTLALEIRNEGAAASNVRVTIDGGESVHPATGNSARQRLTHLAPGASGVVYFRLVTEDSLVNYPVEVAFEQAGSSAGSERVLLNLQLAPFLKVKGFTAVPEDNGRDFLLRFRLQNLGNTKAQEISVRLGGEHALPRAGSNLLVLPRLSPGAETELAVMMTTASAEGPYIIPLELNYLSPGGGKFSGSETIAVTAAALGRSVDGGPPRVSLSKYLLSEKQVFGGDTIGLMLHITNNGRREVGNIRVSLGVQQAAGGGEAGGTPSGTVFSPVNSSNSFFIDKIDAGETIIREVSLFVDPNATAKTYTMPVDIEYQEAAGGVVREMVNIPVLQETRLKVLAVSVPPVGAVGQPVPVTADFVNIGKVALKNLLVSIVGDFPTQDATHFVASLEIGQSEFFQGTIIPQGEGRLEGQVVFTYLDATNQEVRLERPFAIDIEQMVPPGPGEFPPGEPLPEDGRSGVSLLWLLAGLPVVACVLWVLRRRARARRGELFDEGL